MSMINIDKCSFASLNVSNVCVQRYVGYLERQLRGTFRYARSPAAMFERFPLAMLESPTVMLAVHSSTQSPISARATASRCCRHVERVVFGVDASTSPVFSNAIPVVGVMLITGKDERVSGPFWIIEKLLSQMAFVEGLFLY